MFLFGLIISTMSAIVLIVTLLISALPQKAFLEEEKSSPFECGFLPQKPVRSPFSVHFFLLAILFLVFDIELVLLFPWLLNTISSSLLSLWFLTLLFLLAVGLIYEWSAKMLDWID